MAATSVSVSGAELSRISLDNVGYRDYPAGGSLEAACLDIDATRVPPEWEDSDALDSDGVSVRGERSEVPDVATEHHPARLGTSYHDRIHSRAPSG